MTSKIPLSVEIHGCLDPSSMGVAESAHDISEYLVSCNFSFSTQSPYEAISVQLSIPIAAIDRVLPGELYDFGPGSTQFAKYRTSKKQTGSAFWLVVRDTSEKLPGQKNHMALAWGKVDAVTIVRGVDPQSGGQYSEVSIEASSWANLLQETKLITSPMSKEESIAPSIMTPQEFNQAYQKSLRALFPLNSAYNVGRALSAYWKAGLNRGRNFLNLPDSLFMFADSKPDDRNTIQKERVSFAEIPVVYSFDDRIGGKNKGAQVYAPTYGVGNQVIHVPGGVPAQMGGFAHMNSGTWWSVLTGMFEIDPMVVEMMPVLDVPPGSLLDAKAFDRYESSLSNLSVDSPEAAIYDFQEAWQGMDSLTANNASKKYQSLVLALGGARPALLYRMKPFVDSFDRDNITRWFKLPTQAGYSATSNAAKAAAVHQALATAKVQDSDAYATNLAWRRKRLPNPFGSVEINHIPAFAEKSSLANPFVFFADDIFDYTETVSDDRIINGAVVYNNKGKGPAGPMSWDTGMTPRPVIHQTSPYHYGLRVYEVTWPFHADTIKF